MTVLLNRPATQADDTFYPESDGNLMADNMTQARYMSLLRGGIDAVFRDRPDVLVAMDLLWYPVYGEPGTVAAPDVMVVLGRPRGDRRSYKQWEEGGIPPQVVFEIRSHNNSPQDVFRYHDFYQEHGVEEFYYYEPEDASFIGFQREENHLRFIKSSPNWTSPRLGIRFAMEDGWLVVYGPDGRRFQDYPALVGQLEATEAQLQEAAERLDAVQAKLEAEQRQRERMAARLRELGVDPDSVSEIE